MTLDLGCGGMLVCDGKILLMKRKTVIFDGYWSNPGGSVEEGESVEDACVREFFEEVGMVVRIVKKLGDYEHNVDGVLKGLFTGFIVEHVSGEAVIKEPDKCSELKWFALDDLPSPIAPFTEKYLKDL